MNSIVPGARFFFAAFFAAVGATALVTVATASSARAELYAANSINGGWQMTSARCVNHAGAGPLKYPARVDLQINDNKFNADGDIAGFACNIAGNYTADGTALHFHITEDGGCPLNDYLHGKFDGTISGHEMTVDFPASVGSLLCANQESTIHVVLAHH